MTHLYDLFHENCAFSYFRGIFELRKLDFVGLKGQFDVKKANFRGLFAGIDYLKTTLPFKIPVWPIFIIHGMGIVPLSILKGFQSSEI